MQENRIGPAREIRLTAYRLTCIRDDRTLFSGLSFELRPRQVLLIEGRNGSGKTSLLRILCGIRLQDSGEVNWCGEPINKLGGEYHKHIAYVGHMDGVKFGLTALENLQTARSLARSSEITLYDALAQVGLGGFEDVLAQKLSAGQRRRIALARLLVTDCSLWIVDEPFTSLDTDGVAIFQKMLRRHMSSDGMVALTTHHQTDLKGVDMQRVHLHTE